METVKAIVIDAVQWLKLGVEVIGAFVIAVGVIISVYQFARTFARQSETYVEVRQTLVRYLALALEFQLGADILATAITPSWDQIGKLGAIAIIRTGLNYFLIREMNDERGKTYIKEQVSQPVDDNKK